KVRNQSLILCLIAQLSSIFFRSSFFNAWEFFLFDFCALIFLMNILWSLELRIKCLALDDAHSLITSIFVPEMGTPDAYASIAGLGMHSLTPLTNNKSIEL